MLFLSFFLILTSPRSAKYATSEQPITLKSPPQKVLKPYSRALPLSPHFFSWKSLLHPRPSWALRYGGYSGFKTICWWKPPYWFTSIPVSSCRGQWWVSSSIYPSIRHPLYTLQSYYYLNYIDWNILWITDFWSVGTEKPSHPVDEEGSESPRASKKRRTESGTGDADNADNEDNADNAGDVQVPSQPDAAADQIPGNQIEKELASALGSGFSEHAERDSDGNNKVEATIEKTPEQETTEATSTIDPDMATVISNIMNHAERVEDELGRQQRGDNNDLLAPKGLAFVKANSHLKTQSLPILDNLVRIPLLHSAPTWS